MFEHELFSYSPGEDPEGRRGRTFFAAFVQMERAQTVRRFVGWLLAVLAFPCWIMAMWPGLADGLPRRLALAAWPTLVAVFAYHSFVLWRCRRVLAGFAAVPGAGSSPAGEATQGSRPPTARALLDQSRGTLLAAASHELRSPLAVVTGAATTLREQRVPAATRGE